MRIPLTCASFVSRTHAHVPRRLAVPLARRDPCGAALDILEGNEGEANRLLLNDGFGGFTEDTSSAFAVGTRYTSCIFAADVNGDGGECACHRATRKHTRERNRSPKA